MYLSTERGRRHSLRIRRHHDTTTLLSAYPPTQRVATLIVYLSTLLQRDGGATHFPRAEPHGAEPDRATDRAGLGGCRASEDEDAGGEGRGVEGAWEASGGSRGQRIEGPGPVSGSTAAAGPRASCGRDTGGGDRWEIPEGGSAESLRVSPVASRLKGAPNYCKTTLLYYYTLLRHPRWTLIWFTETTTLLLHCNYYLEIRWAFASRL